MTNSIRILTIVTSVFFSAYAQPLRGDQSDNGEASSRRYFVDAVVFSFQPDRSISSYRGHGSGGGSPNSTLGLFVAEGSRRFGVSIEVSMKARRFRVLVEVDPGDTDTRTEARRHEYDLSNLRPRTLDIARDDDGRVFRLALVPRVVVEPGPKPFQVSNLRLENWSFPASPVILNDTDYLGQLGMSNGSLAWCDVPALAKIEFSLLHLEDAHPWGVLQDGTIDITHEDGTTLRITNVKNGIHQRVLEGGPYRVWVRWERPTQTLEQYRDSIHEQVTKLKERLESGDTSLSRSRLEWLEDLSKSGRIILMSYGIRSVKPHEVVSPE